MPPDNEFSPLFGHMQPSAGGEKELKIDPETPVFPDTKNTILETLAGPENSTLPDSDIPTVFPVSEVMSVPVLPTDLLPEIHDDISVPPPLLDTLSVEDDLDGDIPLRILTIPQQGESAAPKTSPEIITQRDAIIPAETPEEDVPMTPASQPVSPPDSKLEQYLQADMVYQQMIRVEDTEKIRLRLAVRYTLLMFAIFLALAWIVSNRIIMFGFSEFVWLARIRDVLFAVMAGLFSLTLWFGSVSWTHNTALIAIIRTLAIVFFGAVVIALYIPF